MIEVAGERLEQESGFIRAEVRKAPVGVTYEGRPELVVMAVEDYVLLRQNRKISLTRDAMPIGEIEQIAGNRMDAEFDHLNALMDD